MNYIMKNHSDYFPIFCWDRGQAERRLKIYPNYKHHEDRVMDIEEAKSNPELAAQLEEDNKYVSEYHDQRAVVIEILHELGIPSLLIDGWEGDDLMYICTKLLDESVVVTDDRDLIQLLSPNIKIARPLANELLEYDEWQKEHNDPHMRKYVIAKAVVGDGSDNIPKCCYGVGGKAADFIAETMMANPKGWLDELANSRYKKYRDFAGEESINQFKINMQLIDLTKVVITNDIVEQVVNELNCVKTPNYFKVCGMLGEYEIQNVSIDDIVSTMTKLVATLGEDK